MRNLLLLFAGALLITSCTGSTGQGTVIPNPSAEEAHQGKRSLMLQSNRPSGGRWMTKVELKPWSEYRFTGWVKTEGVQSRGGKGAGFRLDAFDAEYTGLTGTNDWTRIAFVFKTGNDDSSVLSCLLGLDGPASGRAWFDDMSLELILGELNTAVTIDVDDKKEPMSEYIYGQFIEHLGRCIYGGIWAEMLEDRKFWYVPGDRESPWQVRGKRELFSVDRVSPFTGDKTPVLGVDGSGAASLQQSGLGLKPDLDYEGRIILKATPGITGVKVTLRWGEQSQTVNVEKPGGSYSSYPLEFRSGELTHNASLSIEPEGNGK
jgi:alpha-N-arabinofuranosidase